MTEKRIHLHADPGDFPLTLCGRNKPFQEPEAAVYPHQAHLVNCPDCIARIPATPVQVEDDEHRPRKSARKAALFMAVAIAVGIVLVLL